MGKCFGSGIAVTTLLVVGASLLSFGIVRSVGNALDVGLLADEEGQSVCEGRNVGRRAVGADAGVGQVILTHVSSVQMYVCKPDIPDYRHSVQQPHRRFEGRC